MNEQHQLSNIWNIWLSFTTEEEQKGAQYAAHLKNTHQLRTLQEVGYFWKCSPLGKVNNMFIANTEKGLCLNQYQIDGEVLRISAINFFKKGIEPSWQDEANKSGGRFVFHIDRNQQNYQQVYQGLVCYLMGEDFEDCDRVNGVRFVCAKKKNINKQLYRAEIWVDLSKKEYRQIDEFEKNLGRFLEFYQITGLTTTYRSNDEALK